MPWFLKKRDWVTLLVLLIGYLFVLTQVPTTPRYNLRTCGIENPLLYLGRVDYFAELEKRTNHRLHPAADNGFRDVLAACGPRILEQNAMMDLVPWTHLAVHPQSERWYHSFWRPLCEKLEIDPAPRPKYLDSLSYVGYENIRLILDAEKQKALLLSHFPPDPSQPPGELPDYFRKEYRDSFDELKKIPLDLNERPEIAAWLAQYDPVLDLFNASVRKPNYFSPRMRPSDDDGLWCILLPDVQAQRDFARSLQIRINVRIFHGDIDGAWHDAMSMYLLSRKHFQHEPFLVSQFVGLAIEGMGSESLRMILQHGEPTKEQLAKIAADLDSLPPLEGCFNELKLVSSLISHEALKQQRIVQDIVFYGSSTPVLPSPDESLLNVLPLDQNIAGERLTQLFEQSGILELVEEEYHPPGREERERLNEKIDRNMQFIIDHQSSIDSNDPRSYMKLLTIQSRSRFAAERVFRDHVSAFKVSIAAFDKAALNLDTSRISVAEKRYELQHGKEPASLEELVPEFLPEVPKGHFFGE